MSSLRAFAHRLPPLVPRIGWRGMQAAAAVPGVAYWMRDRRAYRALPDAERLRWRDSLPMLTDRLATTPYDSHYLHQDSWAARRVAEHAPARHVDVGSRVDYVCFLGAIVPVTFVDIRPLEAQVENVESVAGSVLAMPFEDRSVESLSCLHVVEHIGLGRYGDPLDPSGSQHAIGELQRVLTPGGQLLLSLPVGRPRVCFNAHRVHDPREVRELVDELELVEFSGVDDTGAFKRHRTLDELADQSYACGMYRLRRPLGS
jgi:SAM-dependent methyltransferase